MRFRRGVDEYTDVAGVVGIPGVDSRDRRVLFEEVDFAVEEGLCSAFRGILRKTDIKKGLNPNCAD